MFRNSAFLLIPVLALVMLMGSFDMVHAKRFGGGKSFGSKSTYSSSAKSSPSYGNTQKQTTATNNQNSRPGFLPRGPFGLIGGLLAGSLIGSLLFGGVGGFGMMDIIIIGVIGWLLMRMLRSRQSAQHYDEHDSHQQQYRSTGGIDDFEQKQDSMQNRMERAQNAWDHLQSRPARSNAQPEEASADVPAGFDTEDFLKGAKIVYSRLQESWDSRDMNDIRQFTTDAVYNEILEQAKADPNPSRTEVILINARLMNAAQEANTTKATVFYDVTMRESQSLGATQQVREVWHFIKQGDGMWKLDGIQQVEQ